MNSTITAEVFFLCTSNPLAPPPGGAEIERVSQQREMGVFSLEKRRLRGHLAAVTNYQHWGFKENRARLFPGCTAERQEVIVSGCSKGNYNQKKYAPCEGGEEQARVVQGAVGSPSLEIQNWGREGAEEPDLTLNKLCFEQGVGLRNPQMAIPTWTILLCNSSSSISYRPQSYKSLKINLLGTRGI